MSHFCPNCHKEGYISGLYCTGCGYRENTAPPQQQYVQQQYQQPYQPQPQFQQPYQPQRRVKGKKQKRNKPQPPKTTLKQKLMRVIGVLTAVAAVAFLWFAFGNMLTLTIHTNDVADTVNAGSLHLSGLYNESYEELPQYVKETIGDSAKTDNGPVVEAMLPYVHMERVKVNGFFGGSTVEYEITAPDLESWLLNADLESFSSQEQLLFAMTEYIGSAPRKTRSVTVQYHRDGFFAWQGTYNTPEFLDAICGGISSAYTQLYNDMMAELEAQMS